MTKTNLNTAVLGNNAPICFSQAWPVLHFNSYYSGSGGINRIFSAGFFAWSITPTLRPRRPASMAANMPAAPAPRITTSTCSIRP